MYFNKILVGFIILGVLFYIFGDRIAVFRAHLMMNMGYDIAAYDAYDQVIKYYPKSPHCDEAKRMQKALIDRNHEVATYVKNKIAGYQKQADDLNKKNSYR